MYLTLPCLEHQIPEYRSRVIGGFQAIQGRFPYGQVSLLKGNLDKHQCGGTVVAPDLILTAAHCEEHFHSIKVGEYERTQDLSSTTSNDETLVQTFDVIDKIVHPSFEPTYFRFDVMLVKLDSRIQDVEPIRLNSDDQTPNKPALLTLIGWGSTNHPTDNEDRIYPDVLQQAIIPYVPNDVCENSEYEGSRLYTDEIFDEMLCAGRTGVDACRGDSGSPLILENIFQGDMQVGLVSWGRGCGKYPGVYTRISKVFSWIREEICWHSMDPPYYLECEPHERPPIHMASESPSTSPFDLTTMESSDSWDYSDEAVGASEFNTGVNGINDNSIPESSWNFAETTSGSPRVEMVGCQSVLVFCFILLAIGIGVAEIHFVS